MKSNSKSYERGQVAFFIFRFLYNAQLKNSCDNNRAFARAKTLFFFDHGFCPYQRLEDYQIELFAYNCAYQKICN
jgi:hypothetical protein